MRPSLRAHIYRQGSGILLLQEHDGTQPAAYAHCLTMYDMYIGNVCTTYRDRSIRSTGYFVTNCAFAPVCLTSQQAAAFASCILYYSSNNPMLTDPAMV
jgi:hypothetical protein